MKPLMLLCALSVSLLLVLPVQAQSDEEEKSVEFFGGYGRVTTGDRCCVGSAHGFHLGIGYTPIRFLLLGADFSHAEGTGQAYVRHFHVGPQVRIPVKSLRPFGRVLAGVTDHRSNCQLGTDLVPITYRESSFGFGGGLDLQVHSRVYLRAFSFDRIRMEDEWDLRASFGVVLLMF
ncbi:MAG TPA: hypothetical protein PLP42_14025 [Acidobacteriota bacterium]|jgi:hypothetical protein|nr:hypothetical protein [Acidobacteriota bacterium]